MWSSETYGRTNEKLWEGKEESIKGVHVDILREEQGEYVLCKDIGKSSDEKSKID